MLDIKTHTLENPYHPESFTWRIRKVYNWLGSKEIMIELDELEGCVSYGDTVMDAKKGLSEALYLWIQKYGENQLPDIHQGAHLILIDEPMDREEFNYINTEMMKLKDIR